MSIRLPTKQFVLIASALFGEEWMEPMLDVLKNHDGNIVKQSRIENWLMNGSVAAWVYPQLQSYLKQLPAPLSGLAVQNGKIGQGHYLMCYRHFHLLVACRTGQPFMAENQIFAVFDFEQPGDLAMGMCGEFSCTKKTLTRSNWIALTAQDGFTASTLTIQQVKQAIDALYAQYDVWSQREILVDTFIAYDRPNRPRFNWAQQKLKNTGTIPPFLVKNYQLALTHGWS